ncbi:MAG TPA: nucleotide exchange factor GrpE [Candidatus Angelobacter sp.]|nr:nucleotide exchange factor GrpE [Candidatus Angelobacter sp.]
MNMPNTPEMETQQAETKHQQQKEPGGVEQPDQVQHAAGKPEDTASRPADSVAASDEYRDLQDRFARVQAEFENFRKRVTREQLTFQRFAVADALTLLLPVLDSFELALQSAPPNLEEFRSGMELIQRQLRDALGKLGLEAVPAKGEPFNPHMHEAVEVVHQREAADDQVVDELRRGYRLGDRLLRPSMVVVARNPDR